MTARKATVVITSYNGRLNLERCLPSVLRMAAHGGLCDEVLVIDDCSTDDSVEFLASRHPQVKVVRLRRRASFLGAANEGFRRARNRFVALLSNDMIPEDDFLIRLLSRFDDPQVFAAHASLYSPQGKLESQRTVGRFLLGNFKILNTAQRHRGLAGLLLPRRKTSPFSLYSGGCAIFDREKFHQLGGLDAMYFPFYWEDVDLCYRAWKRGWKTLSVPEVRVVHHHEECGTIRNNFDHSYVRIIERRNRFLFLWSNIDSPVYLVPHALHLLVSLFVSAFLGRFGFYASLWQALKRLPLVVERRQARQLECLSDADIFARVTDAEETSPSFGPRTARGGHVPVAPMPVLAGLDAAGPVGQG